jgi:hypothetical protein
MKQKVKAKNSRDGVHLINNNKNKVMHRIEEKRTESR